MAERRRIVIETGADPDRPLSTPHFDAEATMTARPVVPLGEQEAHPARRAAKPFWKSPAFLVLVVLAATGIGVATGIGIGVYRSRNAAQTPAAAAQPSPAEQTAQAPAPTPTPQARVVVPATEEPTAKREEDENDRPDVKDRDVEGGVKKQPPAAPEKRRGDEADKTADDEDEQAAREEAEERRAERERRREERRERRRREREDGEINIPREVERAGRELDRIRDIFEGKQP